MRFKLYKLVLYAIAVLLIALTAAGSLSFAFLTHKDAFAVEIAAPSIAKLHQAIPFTVTIKNRFWLPLAISYTHDRSKLGIFPPVEVRDGGGAIVPCPGLETGSCQQPSCFGSLFMRTIQPYQSWTATGDLNELCSLKPGTLVITEVPPVNLGGFQEGSMTSFTFLPYPHGQTGSAIVTVEP